MRCGGPFNERVTKNLLLSLKKFLKSVNIWRSYRQQGWLSHTLCAPGRCPA